MCGWSEHHLRLDVFCFPLKRHNHASGSCRPLLLGVTYHFLFLAAAASGAAIWILKISVLKTSTHCKSPPKPSSTLHKSEPEGGESSVLKQTIEVMNHVSSSSLRGISWSLYFFEFLRHSPVKPAWSLWWFFYCNNGLRSQICHLYGLFTKTKKGICENLPWRY